jgi:hypothetical protein
MGDLGPIATGNLGRIATGAMGARGVRRLHRGAVAASRGELAVDLEACEPLPAGRQLFVFAA